MNPFIRATAFVTGLASLVLAMSIIGAMAFSDGEIPSQATPAAIALCSVSIGFLLTVREGELNDDIEQKLRWARFDARSSEASLDNYRFLLRKQAEEINELQLDNAFLREKYHKDIEGAKYETV